MTNFNIQIVSDTVCPWCYVGHRRLSRAIATHKQSHPKDTFSITWRAFYLNPEAPAYPGVDKQEHYASKFGAERATALFSRLAAVGAEEGIAFKFGGRSGRTRDSHRLIAYAGKKQDGVSQGLQTRVVEALFRAYFEEEKNITDRAVLLEAGVRAGLDKAEVEKLLDSDEGGAEVDAEAESARRRFISGVPHFTIQGKYVVSGAETPDAFLEAFEVVKQDEK
ncbi:thioredoxin, putative [Paecilomyces variotii No. 5]|uniref:Thioredoxin, putative n=1 Tax=Byssochlamys spectabilis (strain No. 5 / NBRC 109023) TaxID=1356009 RepID=V5G0C9_BYSSN|nr:thioredoxin, putative [Paecilomyces variotii No. 5]